MRRIIVIVIFLVMFVVPVAAETIDFSSMTLEELLALRIDLDAEIKDRYSGTSHSIYNGTYFVGRDMKAGHYLIYNDNPNTDYMSFTVTYPSDSSISKITEYIDHDKPYYLWLEDGCVLVIREAIMAHIEMIPSSDWAL